MDVNDKALQLEEPVRLDVFREQSSVDRLLLQVLARQKPKEYKCTP
ncbi:hypothetical protein PMI31_00654 [Pseudomonas sp. GM55]|nr:hypothetical protein PMI31_00654 [Pseudomonas sp. GM55]